MIDWPPVDVVRGDMRAVLAERYEPETFHAGVCDPPYGLGFMNKGWDHGVPGVEFWQAYYRVLKPGAHLVAFSSPRTYHRLTVAIEDAGFEIRDCLLWLYGTGFPKGLDVAKAIDKRRHDRDGILEVCRWVRERRDAIGLSNGEIDAAFGFNGMAGHWTSVGTQPAVPTLEQVPGLLIVLRITEAEVPSRVRELLVELNGKKGEFGAAWHAREITGEVEEWEDRQNYALTSRDGLRRDVAYSLEARQWEGWNTALKPGWEPIILARKPLPSGWTIADNILEHGTGAINVGACRLGDESTKRARTDEDFGRLNDDGWTPKPGQNGSDAGRWPANVTIDPEAAALIDTAAGNAGGHSSVPATAPSELARMTYNARDRVGFLAYDDAGGASRFFYCAKASRNERDAGLAQTVGGGGTLTENIHPTVKPMDLMRWCCRLVTPPGGRILDAFVGSGTTLCAATLEGFDAVGIDLDTDETTGQPIGYVEIARARSAYWRGEAIRLAEGGARPPADAAPAQLDIF